MSQKRYHWLSCYPLESVSSISQSAMSRYFSGQSLTPLIWPRLWRLPWKRNSFWKQNYLPISNRHLFTHQIVNFKNKIRPEQLPSLNGNHSECNSHSTQRARLREIKVSRSHQNRSGQYLSAWSGARSGGHQGVLLQDGHSQGVHCQGDRYHPSPGVGQGFECRTPLVYLLST